MAVTARRTFPSDPHRRALLAKVHIAPKTLGMTEEDYRATIRKITGQLSSRSCTIVQLQALVREFERQGFSAAARPKKAAAATRADHPVARKARAMWISLGLLCAIRDHGEGALEAFGRRQLGVDKIQWMDQAQADGLIEGLKAMAQRHGWSLSVKGLAREHHVFAFKRRLCDAILFKLKRSGVIPTGWELGDAAWKLCGLGDPDQSRFDMTELDQIANALGRVLRDKGGQRAFDEVAS